MSFSTRMAASVLTRLATGAFPLLFLLVFGWAYGRSSFNLASAAFNLSIYLNLLLLGGFVLVPPAVTRLRLNPVGRGGDADLKFVADHIALCRNLLVIGAAAGAVLVLTSNLVFPAFSSDEAELLRIWCALLSVLALAQLPFTLWLGVAQALDEYLSPLLLVALPRVGALAVPVICASMGLSPTMAMGAAITVVLVGQVLLSRLARTRAEELAPALRRVRGKAGRVLRLNLSAASLGFVGAGVSILPVTLVGRFDPGSVGAANAMIAASNAIGSLVVAAYFPRSLTLPDRLLEQDGVKRYCHAIVRELRWMLLPIAVIFAVGWICDLVFPNCPAKEIGVLGLVLTGAALRLCALGSQHVALYVQRPHLSLFSATVESLVAVLLMWLLLPTFGLWALGVAILFGGLFRFGLAAAIEVRWLAEGQK